MAFKGISGNKRMYEVPFSVEGFEELRRDLEREKKRLHAVPEKIAGRVADIMYEEIMSAKYTAKDGNNPYRGTAKIAKKTADGAIAKITDDEAKAYFYEYGTGIVGENNPTINPTAYAEGWQYDINAHGEGGWIYPKKDGTFGRTSGLRAMNAYYNAFKKAESEIDKIAKEELLGK